jgi:acyl-CoA synthetase (AMP-forming)/AMP-acid ligase II
VIETVLRHRDERIALIAPAEGVQLSYNDLARRVEELADWMLAVLGGRELVFLAPGPDVQSVLLLLASLRAGLPLCLVEPQAEPLARLVRAYHPGLVLVRDTLGLPEGWNSRPAPTGAYLAGLPARRAEHRLHPDLALLLTTSGSTGSPKLVRLTAHNLLSNASAIASYLEIGPGERAVQSLPIHYSYGLSVLNSHLVAGGAVVLTPHSFLQREFWKDADEQRATSFAGVPYMYETLYRLRFDSALHPSVRTFTQAGGALRRELIAHFHRCAVASGARLVVMYGQTEATARISFVPPDRLADKIGSIGVAIPGGLLRLEPVERYTDLAMQLVYEGGNVMMGYAEAPADLALGDVLRGVLRTGDLATVDGDGYFTLVGRLQRFAKLFGRRVSLEDVERELESAFPVHAMATESAGRLALLIASRGEAVEDDAVVAHVARWLAVPPGSIGVRLLSELPRTASGKKDYRAAEMVE